MILRPFATLRSGIVDAAFHVRDMLLFPNLPAILMYHSIGDHPSFSAVSVEAFSWQMAYLRDHGYAVISLHDCISSLRDRRPLPPRSVVITFDDGYEDNYSAAFPILRRHGYPATIFLVSGWIGNKSFVRRPGQPPQRILDASQAREMLSSGLISFGAHTMAHPRLGGIPSAAAEAEMRDSRDAICRMLGVPCPYFAYPYGDHGACAVPLARRHFSAALTVRRGLISVDSDFHLLPRQSIDSLVIRARFPLKLPA